MSRATRQGKASQLQAAALLADLLAFDLASVNLREIPRTAALLEQKIRSFGHVDSWWFERLMAGQQTHQFALWRDTVPKDQLLNDYLNASEKIGIRRRAGEVEIGTKRRRSGQRRAPWQKSQSTLKPYSSGPTGRSACTAMSVWRARP